MMIYMSRKVYFSAMHVYRVNDWTEEENRQVFGIESNPNGHGHDYTLEVTVRSKLNSRSGMLINISEIDKIAKEFCEELDGKFLNYEHPYFKQIIPTTENLLNYIWTQLDLRIEDCELWKLRLSEGSTTFIEKERESMLSLARKYHFCASHRLHSVQLSDEENIDLFGKCNNHYGHGHNYYVEVSVIGEPDPVTGMIMSAKELDHIVNEVVINRFDHKHLNLDTEEFKELNPTSENVVKVIWELLAPHLPKLYKIGLWETEKNYFEYFGPEPLVLKQVL